MFYNLSIPEILGTHREIKVPYLLPVGTPKAGKDPNTEAVTAGTAA